MKAHRRTAVTVGVLFIIATAFLFIGSAFYEPILSSPDYLELAYPNRQAVVVGILLEFACVIAIPLIAVFAFPVLQVHHEAFALGYVAFRLFEAVLLAGGQIGKLSLIGVSQSYIERRGVDAAPFLVTGSAIQAVYGWSFNVYLLIFTLGASMFYALLYRSRLVPRWISAWGLLAAALLFTGTVLIMLDALGGASTAGLDLLFAPPIAVNEMVLAIWLIIKGLSPAAIPSQQAV